MSVFEQALDATIIAEGGYKLTNIKGDRGGMTYAGIARKFHPNWKGWPLIDQGKEVPKSYVQEFYKINFWDVLKLDEIVSASVASSIFDFGVNCGTQTSAKLAQRVANVSDDGVIGSASIRAINAIDQETFNIKFTLEKIKRYAKIANNDKTQHQFFLGWVNRAIEKYVR